MVDIKEFQNHFAFYKNNADEYVKDELLPTDFTTSIFFNFSFDD